VLRNLTVPLLRPITAPAPLALRAADDDDPALGAGEIIRGHVAGRPRHVESGGNVLERAGLAVDQCGGAVYNRSGSIWRFVQL
jgi:hypothetical protein